MHVAIFKVEEKTPHLEGCLEISNLSLTVSDHNLSSLGLPLRLILHPAQVELQLRYCGILLDRNICNILLCICEPS